MKILLDENIDIHFKDEFPNYEVSTVKDNNWAGIENGQLLNLAIKNEFNVFISLDANLLYQRNLSNIKLHVIIIKARDSRLAHLKQFTPKIKNFLNNLDDTSKFEVVEFFL